MAKQSFVTGQVLTAAQLTSLQQTAMSGGAASAKTTSYVLVAADAGTAISMTSTSATTITVNTGLFAAGDTVFIQNLGTANLTITAGTATVNTAGSLILPQYDAGILYFVSASSAVFYDYIQVGATSPLTTKGDLYTFSTSDTRLGVGANGTTLVADSAEATGLKWATPTAGGMTLISTTALSGSSISLTSIPQTYIHLELIIIGYLPSSSGQQIFMRFNGDSGTNYLSNNGYTGDINNSVMDSTEFKICGSQSNSNSAAQITVRVPNYTTNSYKYAVAEAIYNDVTTADNRLSYEQRNGYYRTTSAITSLSIRPFNPNFSGGTAYLYGVK